MRASMIVTILGLGLRATVATATPVATASPPGCGHTASTAYGPVSYCNQAAAGVDAAGLASAVSCIITPDLTLPIVGPAVAYAGSSVSTDGAGTFQFFGGPQVSTAYGPASFGEQRRGSGCSAMIRWGSFNFIVGKFFPSGAWMPDAGGMACTPHLCTSHCTQNQNAQTIVTVAMEHGVTNQNLVNTMIGVAACESALHDDAVNHNSNGTDDMGLFQFNSGGTWQAWGGGTNPFSAVDNATAAAKVVKALGFPSVWHDGSGHLDAYLNHIYYHAPLPSYCADALIAAGFGQLAN